MVAGGRLDLTVGRADRPAGAGLLVSAGGYSAQHCPCWPAHPGLTDWLLLLASLVDQDYGRGQHCIPYHSWPSSAPPHANITFPWKCADIPLVRLGKLPCWLLLSIIPPCILFWTATMNYATPWLQIHCWRESWLWLLLPGTQPCCW